MKYSIFVVLLAISHLSVGQNNGYNYDRPVPVGPGGTGGTSIRPGGFPSPGGFPGTGTTPPFGGYPAGPSPSPSRPGFPGAGSTGGGFPGRPGIQGDTPTGPGFSTPGGFPGSTGITGGRPSGVRPTPVFPGSGGRPGTGSQFPTGGTGSSNDDGSYPGGDYSAIPGSPGVDYPIYTEIPQTSFSCQQQQYPGYYADVETQCQVFHICALNRTFDFLCPNGTIFSQETLVCVWWNQFDCASAPALYPNNAFIYDYTQTGQPGQGGVVGGGFGGQPGSGIGAVTQRPVSPGFGQRPGTSPVRPPTGPSAGYPGATGPSGFPGSAGGFPTATGAPAPSPGGLPGGFPGSTAGGFPTGPTGGGGITPAGGFGTTVRPGGGFPPVQGDTGFIGGGSTITPQAPNREYLPPRRT